MWQKKSFCPWTAWKKINAHTHTHTAMSENMVCNKFIKKQIKHNTSVNIPPRLKLKTEKELKPKTI